MLLLLLALLADVVAAVGGGKAAVFPADGGPAGGLACDLAGPAGAEPSLLVVLAPALGIAMLLDDVGAAVFSCFSRLLLLPLGFSAVDAGAGMPIPLVESSTAGLCDATAAGAVVVPAPALDAGAAVPLHDAHADISEEVMDEIVLMDRESRSKSVSRWNQGMES